MKKLLTMLFAAVALVCLLAFSVSAEETTLPTKCPHCNKTVTWEPLTEANAEDVAISSGHRYLAFEADEMIWTTKSIPKKVCLYMNGKTLVSPEGVGRIFNVGGTLNLIGEGTVKGRGFESTDNFGGAINVTGTLNVYGATVTTTGESDRTAGRGGVVYLSGANAVLNLYSGNIIGGKAANGGTLGIDTGIANIYGGTLGGGTATTSGGAVYIRTGGTLNVAGGTVQGGTAKSYGGAVHIHQNATLIVSSGAITGGNATKNGGTVYANANAITQITGGTIGGGTAGNAGGALYVNAGAAIELAGGNFTSGKALLGPCIYVPSGANVTLTGSVSAEEFRFDHYEVSRLNVKGICTGEIVFRGGTGEATDGAIIGTAEEGADLHSADYTVYNTDLTLIHKGTDLVISAVGYIDHVETKRGYCEVCKKNVEWMSYPAVEYENHTYMYSGHYYIDSEEQIINWKQKFIVGNDLVCLDLMGKTLKSNSRAFEVTKGTLNIFDSVGGGVVTGCGPTNVSTVYGGTLFVREPSTLNIYGGLMTYYFADDDRSYVARGGVIYSRGEVNIYGGEVSGGASKAGGNIYMDATADGVSHLGLYGGIVGSNVKVPGASTSGACIVSRGTVLLSGDPQITALMMGSTTYTPALSERVTVEGSFTGSVVFTLSNYAGETDIGQAVNGSLTGSTISFASNDAKYYTMTVVGDELLMLRDAPAALVEQDGAYTAYATVAEAITAADKTGLVILLADAQDITVNGLTHMDLSGHTVTGASGTGVLVCKDSTTDDFTVADGVYGKITGATCQVAAMTVAFAEDNYLAITEEDGTSFHRVQLKIVNSVLRPSAAGLYYKSAFYGDEMVTAKVATVGVILNAYEVPTFENMDTTSLYTVEGKEKFNTTGNSCLLSGIMKTENDAAVNLANAGTSVYASAYMVTDSGEYLFGTTVYTGLQEQVNTINDNWTYMTIQQKQAFMDMYYTYETVMQDAGWSVSNAVSIAQRKVQFETTDYTPYLCPWNFDVVEAAKADGKVHYYFFAGEGLHISDTQTYKDKWGDAYLIVFPNGQTLLVDSGPLSYAPVVAENLRRMGITHLDAILITHPHSDHHNGLFSDSAVLNIGYLKEITVGDVYFRGGVDPDSTTEDLVSRVCRDLNIPCHVMDKGDILYFGDVKLECVWPLEGQGDAWIVGGEEINNMSIVVRIDYGEHSSLLTGDLYMQGEKWMLERVDNSLLDVDFLKVPHHGYNTSSSYALLETVSPELAMSIGRLPIPQKVYDRYAALGIPFLDDRKCGYVEVVGAFDGTLTYETSRNDDGTTTNPDTGDEDVVPDGGDED